jgi:hypothetical protein
VTDIPKTQHATSSPDLSNRRAVPGRCTLHGNANPSITNLVIRKLPNGVIELDPHVDRSCVIQLREESARVVCDALREWLG